MSKVIKDRSEFKQIFEEFYSPLCNFVYRYVNDRDLAEDMVQSVFVRLWENRESIQLTGSLKSYLFTSTRNAALDHIRSNKRHAEMLEQTKPPVSEDPVDDEEAGRMLFRTKLQQAIQQLKPKTKKIFLLHKVEGLTYTEISEHLDIPKRTVEYNIYAALSQLKEKLQSDYDKYIAA